MVPSAMIRIGRVAQETPWLPRTESRVAFTGRYILGVNFVSNAVNTMPWNQPGHCARRLAASQKSQ